jgi:protoporphyrinogen oxidase
MPEQTAVIGAGPAGLATAFTLSRAGVPVDVFEASAVVGGMARSLRLWGHTVDLGPHRFFSSNARVNRLWLDVVGTSYRMVERRTRIYYDGKLFAYPLRLSATLATLGAVEAARCALSYSGRRCERRNRRSDTFEDWVRGRFGGRLYEIFFRTYSEKLWGIPCSRLDADFAAQRIKQLSLFEAVKNAVVRGRTNRHPTLLERFAYPLDGTGSVYEAMARGIIDLGGRVHLETPVRQVVPLPDGSIELELGSGERQSFRHVVSSMPLTLLVRSLPDSPAVVRETASTLRFRNTILVYLRVEGSDLFPDQWLYIHAPELIVGRVTNFRNWVPELYGESADTVLALELWCDPGDALWSESDSALGERALADIRKTGLIKNARVADAHVVRVPFCYPVYDLGYRNHVAVIARHLQTIPGLQAIGRYGSFKYNNQDHSLLMGILAADNIMHSGMHDLWKVNADSTYQESALIDETGLVPTGR